MGVSEGGESDISFSKAPVLTPKESEKGERERVKERKREKKERLDVLESRFFS